LVLGTDKARTPCGNSVHPPDTQQESNEDSAQFIPVIAKSRLKSVTQNGSNAFNFTTNSIKSIDVFEAETCNDQIKSLTFYVGNIKRTASDLAVKSFFSKQGIQVKYLKLIPTSKREAGNGAKIVINGKCGDKIKSLNLPEGIYIRKWYDRERVNEWVNKSYVRS
jgi:hypothetical protein